MEKNSYDVVIIGGGVIGCSIARFLSRFKLKAIVLERHNDVGEETTNANSAIVHSGYDPLPSSLKAKFNVAGNRMMEQICRELDVPFKKIGSLTVGFNKEDEKTLQKLALRSQENKVKCKLVYRDELVKMEPNISDKATVALYCEDAGIVSPFNLCVSFMENAMNNGVELALNTEVINIVKKDELYKIVTKDGKEFNTKIVINASGQNSSLVHSYIEKPRFEINTRKGEYILLDHFSASWIKHTLFMCPTKVGKGVLISPTTSYNYIIGPSNDLTTPFDTSTDAKTFAYLKETAKKLVQNIPYQETIREFAGVRANPTCDDFVIEESKENKGFIEVGGIMSPGLASSPAIGEYVSNMVEVSLKPSLNPNYNPLIKPHLSFKNLSKEEFKKLLNKDKRYGNIVCRCEKISEGEIVDVIDRNCGAHTIKGVKKRCRAGFGKCQGTFCQEETIKILARELKVNESDICYSELGSNILKYPSKGGNN